MTQVLRQSTAVDVLIGPFVDETDGKTAETGETIVAKLSKNGQTLAAKSDITAPVHDVAGYYNCEFDATDTNTVGTLVLTATSSAALPVRHEFQVVEEAIYDLIWAGSATLKGSLDSATGGAILNALDAADLSLTYATKGIQDVLVPGIITATTGINALQTGVNVTSAAGTAWGSGAITAASIASNAIAAAKIATGAITNTKFAAGAIDAAAIAADAIGSSELAASAVDEIVDAVWDEAISGHTTVTNFGGMVQNRLVTATTGINAIQTTQTAHSTSLSTATVGINAIEAAGGATATSIANAVMNQTVADHTDASMFAGMIQNRFSTATTGINAIQSSSGATATEIANAVMNQTLADHTNAAQFAGGLQNRLSTATVGINSIQSGSGATATEIANAVMNQTLADHTDASMFAGGIQNKFSTATTGINAIEASSGATATEIANAVMNQTTADHQTDGTFAGDVLGMLESATDQVHALAAAVQVVDDEVAAIETSITYATKGIQDQVIPRLITATGQLATLATGTQHEFAAIDTSLTYATKGVDAIQVTQTAHSTSLSTATTGINAIEASGGATATEIANAVMNQTSADHTLDGTFAGDVLGMLESATDQVHALAAAVQVVDDEVAAIETSVTYATKGIQDVLIPGIITATTGINDLQNKAATATTGINAVQTTQTAHSASLSTATTGVNAIASAISGLNNISVADILTTQMTEAYAADGTAPTLAQALFLIQQQLGDFSISGTTLTVKQLDGSSTAATFTLDDGTSPTSVTRTG